MPRSFSLVSLLKLVSIPLFALMVWPASAAPPSLESDTQVSKEGYFRLSWQSAGPGQGGERYRLQRDASETFAAPELIYEGKDRATMVTGLSDGEYFFRVGVVGVSQAPIQWSNPVIVEVKHHSLGSAIVVFIAGFVVFVATVAVIVAGALRVRGE